MPYSAEDCATYNPNLHTHKYNGKEFDTTHGLNTYDYGARQYNSLVDRCQYFFGNIYDRISFLKFEIMNKKKTLIYIAIFMFTIWIIAIVHGLHSMSNQPVSEREQRSFFCMEGNIVATKYLYFDHGDIFLVTLRPTSINIYKNELTKSDPFWGVYDKKKNLVFFMMSYWDSYIEKQARNNVEIDSHDKYHIKLTNSFIGNFYYIPDTLVKYENENTIRL